jgi:hypothetical protein
VQHVVTIVDADNSGKIDLDEFLTFLRPEFIPDVRATASSWLGQGRGPMNAVNGIGTDPSFSFARALHCSDAYEQTGLPATAAAMHRWAAPYVALSNATRGRDHDE